MFRFILITLAIAACGNNNNNCPSGDCDPFDTFQACYNEHHMEEMFKKWASVRTQATAKAS